MRTKQKTTREYFSDLSFNFAHLLDAGDDYNIAIEAGEEPDVDTFRAHSVVLRCRSVYFHQALSKEWARTDDKLMIFKKPNIPASAFRIVIKYLYSGVISLDGEDSPTLFRLLLAADELGITEILSFVQDVLLVNHRDWLDLNFEYIRCTVYDHELFDKLHDYCNDMFCANPQLIFGRADFKDVPEQVLIPLIRRQELRLEEVEVWEQIIRWGVQQSPPLHLDVKEWNLKDFAEMKRRLQNLTPHIRFCQISMRDYFIKVRPYERILLDETLMDIQCYHFRSPSDMIPPPPRQGRMNSDIINSTDAALISSWVDRLDRKSYGWSPYEPTENPYVFEPAFRGTHNDFLAGELHRRLNELDETLVVFEMRDGRVIGGYHLLHSDGHLNERDGFVFALGQRDIAEPVVSRISDVRHAIGAGSSSDVDSGISINGVIESNGHYDGGGFEDPQLNAVNTLASLMRHQTQSQAESCYDSDGSDNLSSNTSFNGEHELERSQMEVVKFEVFSMLKRRKTKRLSNVAFNIN